MRIGFDFDNTIVKYDEIFYKVALEWQVIPLDLPANKLAIRDFLRHTDKENLWTEMQGYVYGARMEEAIAYPGVIEFMRHAIKDGNNLAVVSHKTQYPFLGPKYDLHASANAWIQQYLCKENVLVQKNQVFFEVTKEEKLSRIGKLGCDIFIDDLPEILLASDFPKNTKRFLFDPENHHDNQRSQLNVFSSWDTFLDQLLR